MTTDEHIRKLIEAREWALTSAYHWQHKASTKEVGDDGVRHVHQEVTEYDLWLARARQTQEMIDALKPMRVVKALKPPAAPKRGRHLNLA